MGACYKTLPDPVGQAVLAGYSQNYCPSGLTSMRHMPPFIAKIGESLWRAAYHRLPKLCRERQPNVCVMQTYRRGRGDFMDYHTDSRQTYPGQKIAQVCTPHPQPTPTLRPPGSRHRRHHLHHRLFRHALLLPRLRLHGQEAAEAALLHAVRRRGLGVDAGAHTRHAHTHAPPTHTPMPHPPTRARTSTCYIHVHMHMPHPHAHMLHPHAHAHATCTCTHVTSTCTCTCHMCMCTLHPQRDDHRKKHGVWWAPGTPKDAVRHVLVFRWTNVNAKRAYYTEYPHRPVATGARMPMHRARMPCRCPCPSPCPSPCPWPCP